MKYGNLTDPSRPVLKEIDRIFKTGFDFAEISIEGPEGYPDRLLEQKEAIIDLIQSHGSFATAHMAWWAELASAYENVRQAWIVQVKQAIRAARVLRAQKFNVHSHVRGLYLQHKTACADTLERLTDSLKEIIEFAQDEGIVFMLENSASKRDVAKFDDFNQIIKVVPNIEVHVDIAHAYLHGGLTHIDQFLRGFKGQIQHLHISDNLGKDDDHLPLGYGKINFERVVKTLKRIKYDGTITFEIFQKKKEGLSHSLKTFKRLWEKV